MGSFAPVYHTWRCAERPRRSAGTSFALPRLILEYTRPRLQHKLAWTYLLHSAPPPRSCSCLRGNAALALDLRTPLRRCIRSELPMSWHTPNKPLNHRVQNRPLHKLCTTKHPSSSGSTRSHNQSILSNLLWVCTDQAGKQHTPSGATATSFRSLACHPPGGTRMNCLWRLDRTPRSPTKHRRRLAMSSSDVGQRHMQSNELNRTQRRIHKDTRHMAWTDQSRHPSNLNRIRCKR